ncbi:MAG: polysaccharide deacetylase family protein [Syntrophales bacterium]
MNKNALKYRVISMLASTISPPLWARMTRVNPVIFYYHMVSDDDVAHVKHLYRYKSVRTFRAELDFILRHYSPIALDDLLDHVRRGIILPDRVFLLTFDDGFREMRDIVAPILREKGIPAVFFLNSGFIDNRQLCYLHKASLLAERLQAPVSVSSLARVLDITGHNFRDSGELAAWILSIPYGKRSILDRIAEKVDLDFNAFLRDRKPYLTAVQLRALIREGFAIGAHSVDHPPYGAIDIKEQLRQTVESVRSIRKLFDLPYGAFAFPHNDAAVSREFFRKLREGSTVDISFGTGGMITDGISGHLQRCSLENPPLPAERIIALEYARKMLGIMTGNDRVMRD